MATSNDVHCPLQSNPFNLPAKISRRFESGGLHFRMNLRKVIASFVAVWMFFVLSTGSMSAQDPTFDAENTELVKIPGATPKDVLAPLGDAVYCLEPQGTNCKVFGFPADVLAAAFGIDVHGRVFKPERWRLWVPRLERYLVNAKRGAVASDSMSQFGYLDIPGFNRKLYDFVIVRTLVTTDLFPYPMRITSKRIKGVEVPFVVLRHDAVDPSLPKLVKDCFAEAQKTGDCPMTLGTSKNAPQKGPTTSQDRTPFIGRSQNLKTVMRGFIPVSFSTSAVEAVIAPEQRPYCDVKSPKLGSDLADVLACLQVIVNGQGVDRPIVLTGRSGPLQCAAFARLPAEDKKDLDPGACLYLMSLYVTPSAGSLYDRVKVRIHLSNQEILKCGPSELKIPADTPVAKFDSWSNCSNHEATFSLSGKALVPDDNQIEKKIAIYSLDPHTPSTTITIVIVGVDKGLAREPKFAQYCSPKNCGDADKAVIERLRSNP